MNRHKEDDESHLSVTLEGKLESTISSQVATLSSL